MNNELYHHGIIGQKWGIRRYQNKDGSYTYEGKKRRKTFGNREASDSFSWNARQSSMHERLSLESQAIASNPKYRPGYRELMQEAADHHKREAESHAKKAVNTLNTYGPVKLSRDTALEVQRGENRVKSILDKYSDVSMKRYVNTEKDKPHKKGSDEELGSYSASDLMRKIQNEAGDWYNGKGVGENFTRVLAERKRNSGFSKSTNDYGSRVAADRKYFDDLAGAALKDMGYKNTEENRRYLTDMGVIRWD